MFVCHITSLYSRQTAHKLSHNTGTHATSQGVFTTSSETEKWKWCKVRMFNILATVVERAFLPVGPYSKCITSAIVQMHSALQKSTPQNTAFIYTFFRGLYVSQLNVLYVSRSLVVLPEGSSSLQVFWHDLWSIQFNYHYLQHIIFLFIVRWACQKIVRAGYVTQIK